MSDCPQTKILQVTSSGGGGPYTVNPDTPALGQITVTDTGTGQSFVIDINVEDLEQIDKLTPSAQDTIPNLSASPADATKVKFFINDFFDYANMITSDAGGVVSVSVDIFATYGFNVETTDVVTAIYFK